VQPLTIIVSFDIGEQVSFCFFTGEIIGVVDQLWLILGDGMNQAADLASGATSIPS
jgi:hypothetical protein